MQGMKIIGTGSYLPSVVKTNHDFAEYMDTSHEWIVSRTGICERHFCAEGENLHSMSMAAANKAIDAAGIDVSEIGACIVATMFADNITPSEACLLQRDLGIHEEAMCFDMNAACSGFLYAMRVASGFVGYPENSACANTNVAENAEEGRKADAKVSTNAKASTNRPYVLVVGAERPSKIMDFNDRGTAILFGDGAGAAIFCASDKPMYTTQGSIGDEQSLYCNNQEQIIHMEGQAVYRFAATSIPRVVNNLLEQSGKSLEEIDSFLCHQANKRIIDHSIRTLKAPAEKFYMNLDRVGNTSGASVPIALDEMVRSGALKRGDLLLCAGFGAGLTWGGALLEY